MKKLIVFTGLFIVSIMFGLENVFAEEATEVVTEPTAFENWIDVVTDFASLKNFVVTSGGVAVLIALAKVRSAWKFFKSPKGIATLETIGLNILSKLTDKPELVTKLMAIIVEFPIIKQILSNAQRKAELYETELQGKMLDMEAKLSAQVYSGTKLQEATAYLTKLRDEYETIQSSK